MHSFGGNADNRSAVKQQEGAICQITLSEIAGLCGKGNCQSRGHRNLCPRWLVGEDCFVKDLPAPH